MGRHYREAPANLRLEAAKRNIVPDRLVAAPEGNHSFFLDLGAVMDLFLDTSHPLSNGHTTGATGQYLCVCGTRVVGGDGICCQSEP
eukprot:710708-Rhodomonas_salina.6